MTRSTRAARRLISELKPFVTDLEVEEDNLDGLNVYRTLRLKSQSLKGLPDVIDAVEDNRIVSTRSIVGGVEVTFTHTVQADRGSTWNTRDAAHLLSKRAPKKKAAAKPAPEDAD